MKHTKLAILLLLFPVLCLAHFEESPAPLDAREVTLLAGVGNTMGWLGIQAERYFHQERFSVFGGLGYMPSTDPGYPTGFTFAAGARAFTGGKRHRAFLEASVSQNFRRGTRRSN